MSGVTGNGRIKSRKDYETIFTNYLLQLMNFKGFISATSSGSFNSDQKKESFGDMDLIVQVNGALYDHDKKKVKAALVEYLLKKPKEMIVPFESEKYKGKRFYNSGEIVTVSYKTGYIDSCQIDNIIALSTSEAEFKQSFLDMTAEKQGLILGLTKTALIEEKSEDVFSRVGIDVDTSLTEVQEFEFNLSSVEIQLRKVTYDSVGSYKQVDKEVVWSSKKWDDLVLILKNYNLKHSFNRLLKQASEKLKHPRSANRMVGVFSSMISVKSGEVGKEKGFAKERALETVKRTLTGETVGIVVGRFQPLTKAHYDIIRTMARECDKGIVFLVKGKKSSNDKEQNPFDESTQKKLLQSVLPKNVTIKVIPSGFFVDELNNMRESNFVVYAGTDRVESYKRYSGYMTEGRTLDTREVPRSDVDISATKVREALINDDISTFKSLTPPEIHGFYDELHNLIM